MRKKLEEITQSKTLSKGEQISKIHSMGITTSSIPTININCYAYALNLGSSDVYIEIARDLDVYANSDFINFLLLQKLLQITEAPGSGDIVIYFNEDSRPKHGGIVATTKDIHSKWGTIIPVFMHGLWEVPESYGTNIKYYKGLSTEDAEEYFLQYAESVGAIVT